jgi:predicted transcriptional regulator
MTTKERILDVIQRLPDETSFDQAIYELQLIRRIERGAQEAERGDLISHEEVVRMFGEERVDNGHD